MALFLKAAGVCLMGAAACTLLRSESPAVALLAALAASAVILGYGVSALGELKTAAAEWELGGIPTATAVILWKTAGIAVISRLLSDTASEAGMRTLATSVELFGAAASALVALPLYRTLFQLIEGLI